MDILKAIFLHVPLGLKLSNEDVLALFGPLCDPTDVSSVRRCIQSESALNYLAQNHDWFEQSLRILDTSICRGIRWVHIGESEYPMAWRSLSRSPLILSYQGEPCWTSYEMLAVVGSRTPMSDSLLWMQRELAPFLRAKRVGIVSGGARGVDQWAHRIATDSGVPTVCILPSGILNPYPVAGEKLWSRILETGGCLMSTSGLREPMRKAFFHIRNRWIAGLSNMCLVVEANRRSGSLLTADLVNQENREVCTLPVSPSSPQGLGNLDLLMKGAHMVRDQLDLSILWDRYGRLVPNTSEGSDSKIQEEQIH